MSVLTINEIILVNSEVQKEGTTWIVDMWDHLFYYKSFITFWFLKLCLGITLVSTKLFCFKMKYIAIKCYSVNPHTFFYLIYDCNN